MIDRQTGAVKKLEQPLVGHWAAVTVYREKVLAAVTLEGSAVVMDLSKDQVTVLRKSEKQFVLPYLYLEGCSFRNLHPLSQNDPYLTEILESHGAVQ